MCYTSGTTGQPKGVVYSHRAIVIHALDARVELARDLESRRRLLPVVPMFHANAWCFPFSCTLAGVKQVFPGPHLDPVSLLDDFVEREGHGHAPACRRSGWASCRRSTPTRAAGTSRAMRTMTVGGAAPPRAMIEALRRAPRPPHHPRLGHDRDVARSGTISGAPEPGDRPLARRAVRLRAPSRDSPIPFVEIRARGGEGLVPWDGATMGELEVRGPSDRVRRTTTSPEGARPLDRRRLVQDRRHRHDPRRRLRRDPGPLEGPRQVGRRVDLDRRARERAHGPPGRARRPP